MPPTASPPSAPPASLLPVAASAVLEGFALAVGVGLAVAFTLGFAVAVALGDTVDATVTTLSLAVVVLLSCPARAIPPIVPPTRMARARVPVMIFVARGNALILVMKEESSVVFGVSVEGFIRVAFPGE